VIRHGKLVVEHYWTRDGSNTLHDMRSATKSITSLLVGITIDRGAISGVEEPVMLRLKEAYPSLRNPDPWKDGLTIEQLLLMRTGLACNDWDANSPGNEENMYPRRDWVRFFLDLPVAPFAASFSRYCTAGVVTLGRVVKEATQQPTEQFADEVLLGPLGIRNYCWATFDEGQQIDTGGHLHLRPRDMAKIGQLVLQRGSWHGQQLVSEAWIDQSTQSLTQLNEEQPYGYLWWVRRAPMNDTGVPYVAAEGNGGQYIFVVPSYDLVVVFTGSNYNNERENRPFYILESLILPAFLPG
jgi:CubicO group peptidase (beta-lactamase class C family)